MKFEAFLEDMGRRPTSAHSIERRENNGHYEPTNCYWATRQEQNRNTRRSHIVTIGPKTAALAEWLTRANVSRRTYYRRKEAGMTDAEALGLS